VHQTARAPRALRGDCSCNRSESSPEFLPKPAARPGTACSPGKRPSTHRRTKAQKDAAARATLRFEVFPAWFRPPLSIGRLPRRRPPAKKV
jgi:hypothetical protein